MTFSRLGFKKGPYLIHIFFTCHHWSHVHAILFSTVHLLDKKQP